MITPAQQKLIIYTREKVRALFLVHPVPAHDFDHVARVVRWAAEIAKGEGADEFLCELAAWMHDIGRTIESEPGAMTREHPELSYQLLRQWFKDDPKFKFLSRAQKLELLYAVRYHWNNAAEKYQTAWILRDADKLDTFGQAGVGRLREHYMRDEVTLNTALRFNFENLYWIKTDTAREILQREKLLEPMRKIYLKFLKDRIKKVEL